MTESHPYSSSLVSYVKLLCQNVSVIFIVLFAAMFVAEVSVGVTQDFILQWFMYIQRIKTLFWTSRASYVYHWIKVYCVWFILYFTRWMFYILWTMDIDILIGSWLSTWKIMFSELMHVLNNDMPMTVTMCCLIGSRTLGLVLYSWHFTSHDVNRQTLKGGYELGKRTLFRIRTSLGERGIMGRERWCHVVWKECLFIW